MTDPKPKKATPAKKAAAKKPAGLPAPADAAERGRALWADVTSRLELDQPELELLREAVRTVDMLDKLAQIAAADGPVVDGKGGPRAHPALVEARQLRITYARLQSALRLPEDPTESTGRPQRRAGARGTYQLHLVV